MVLLGCSWPGWELGRGSGSGAQLSSLCPQGRQHHSSRALPSLKEAGPAEWGPKLPEFLDPVFWKVQSLTNYSPKPEEGGGRALSQGFREARQNRKGLAWAPQTAMVLPQLTSLDLRPHCLLQRGGRVSPSHFLNSEEQEKIIVKPSSVAGSLKEQN